MCYDSFAKKALVEAMNSQDAAKTASNYCEQIALYEVYDCQVSYFMFISHNVFHLLYVKILCNINSVSQ